MEGSLFVRYRGEGDRGGEEANPFLNRVAGDIHVIYNCCYVSSLLQQMEKNWANVREA